MIEICNAINLHINQPDINSIVYSLCELVIKENQHLPITCDTRVQVAPKDSKDLIIYHRLLSGSSSDDVELSFGSNFKKRISQRLRTVVFLKQSLGEDLIYEIINSYPEKIDLPGYKLIDIGSDFSLNVDHESIHQEELGGSDYERHRITWNIYAIEFSVEFIKC